MLPSGYNQVPRTTHRPPMDMWTAVLAGSGAEAAVRVARAIGTLSEPSRMVFWEAKASRVRTSGINNHAVGQLLFLFFLMAPNGPGNTCIIAVLLYRG